MENFEIKVEFAENSSANFSDAFAEFERGNYVFDQPLNVVLICTYIPLFLIALLSNLLIILVVGRYRCLRSVTNYFIVNLSIADLLVTLICMPVAVGQSVTHLWLYGFALCKLTHYLQAVAVGASVFTITVMSIDRYLAIRHPMSRKIINRRTTRKVIFCLWTLSLVIFSPILYIRKMRKSVVIIADQKYEENFCVEDTVSPIQMSIERASNALQDVETIRAEQKNKLGPCQSMLILTHCLAWTIAVAGLAARISWPDNLSRKTFGTFCFVVVYAIPGIIVVLAYSLMGLRLCSRHLLPEYQVTQGMSSPGAVPGLGQFDSSNSAWQVSSASGRLVRERRRVAKILLILALVFAVCWLPYSVLSLILDLTNQEDEIEVLALNLLPFAILLGHVNSAVNPLLYCLLSKNFRRSVTELVRHPTRAFRTRQPHKIRMTFRKDPPEVNLKDKNSSKEHVSNRPRNHHAPDPAEAQSESSSHGPHGSTVANRLASAKQTQTNAYSTEPIELCVIDRIRFNKRGCGENSPSSSGYSSLRHSVDALTMLAIKENTGTLCSCPHFDTRQRLDDKNCHHCSNWNSCACLAERTNATVPKRSFVDTPFKRSHLHDTICEESDCNARYRTTLYSKPKDRPFKI